MSFSQVFFLLIAAVTLGAATMVISTRRMMWAALWFVLVLVGVAAVFALLDASFFAVVQVLVYIGAIATLIIFADMLTRNSMDENVLQSNKNWPWALAVCVTLFAGMVYLLSGWEAFNLLPADLPKGAGDLAQFGIALSSPDGYLIPFEVSSVLLLAALVGAIYLAVERRGEKK